MGHPYICIAGKNDIAVDVLDYVIRNYGKDSLGIVCNKTETGENSFQRSLRRFALKNNIREHRLEEIYGINNLLFISLEFDQLIKPYLLKDARLYNIHFSMLPKYKGMFTSAHPILNGEHYSGVTLHLIDAGIDTGDIIDQQQFEIEDSDDCKDIYLKYIKYGTEVVLKNIDDLIWNRAMARAQSVQDSSYYSRKSLDYSNLCIDLNQTAEGIGRQIRAFSFRNYQLPQVFGKQIIDFQILNSKSLLKPGTAILREDSFVTISTIDYNMSLYFDRFDELMEACEIGNLDTVKDICVVRKHINEQDKNGWSPLIKATYNNRIEIVEYLIAFGANVRMKNRNGTNLLMYAKETYKRSRDNTLFKLFCNLGVSEKEMDYDGHDLLYYIEKDRITLKELKS